MEKSFSHFVGIDWSGAKGKRHSGLAVALCGAGVTAPRLISPPSGHKYWSRIEVADWLKNGCGLGVSTRMLVGIDSAFSMPFMDKGAYLDATFDVSHVKPLWKAVESACEPAVDLYGGAFAVSHKCHYHQPGAKGGSFSRRMRVTESRAVETGAGPCESVFHLIGPSQVGLSGLSTMRMLARLSGYPGVAVWPYDSAVEANVVLTEIYAANFAQMGGHRGKFRDSRALNDALANLGSRKIRSGDKTLSDDAADALVTAAALRHIADSRKYWHPAALSTKVRETEGWIFGVT